MQGLNKLLEKIQYQGRKALLVEWRVWGFLDLKSPMLVIFADAAKGSSSTLPRLSVVVLLVDSPDPDYHPGYADHTNYKVYTQRVPCSVLGCWSVQMRREVKGSTMNAEIQAKVTGLEKGALPGTHATALFPALLSATPEHIPVCVLGDHMGAEECLARFKSVQSGDQLLNPYLAWTREVLAMRTHTSGWVPTELQLADPLNKPVSAVLLESCFKTGLVDLPLTLPKSQLPPPGWTAWAP